jgi:Fe-S cluster assembly protein SufB
MGQFERTLIIVDEGASVHYVEGCTAPMYSSESLHSAVVEIIVKSERPLPLHHDPELVQQRLQPRHQAGDGLRRFADGVGRRQPRLAADDEVPGRLSDGSRGARGESCRSRSPARASTRTPGPNGPLCPNTSSRIISKSISKNGGRQQLSRAGQGQQRSDAQLQSNVVCDALILDPESRSDTYPYIEVEEQDVRSSTRPASRRSPKSSSST